MGLLRFLLAFVVILAHTDSRWRMIGGDHAVEAFFIISGFLMALILNEKYIGAGSLKAFYTGRALRLFPLFWLLTFVVYLVSLILWKSGHDPAWLAYYVRWADRLAPSTWLYLISVNVLAIGQDTAFFLKINQTTGVLEPAKNFRLTDPPLYWFLGIGQAWSLAVEIYFYLLAPWLVRRKEWVLVVLLAAAALLRYRLFRSSFGFDPWVGRFLPAEMMFFLLGIVGYLAYKRLRERQVPRQLMQAALVVDVLLTAFYQWLPQHWLMLTLYYIIFACSIPLVFMLTKKSKRDAWLGNFSFPIYIIHTLPLYFVHRLCIDHAWSSDIEAVIETACVMPLAWLTIKYFENPLESWRSGLMKRLLAKPTAQS